MKGFKTVLLFGVMALVAWGVWRTLTAHPTHSAPHEGMTDGGSAPPWDGHATTDEAAHGGAHMAAAAPYGGGFSGTQPGGPHDPLAIEPIDTGPPLPVETLQREEPQPKVGGPADMAVVGETPGASTSPDPLEVKQRLGEFDTMMKRVKGLVSQRQFKKAHAELSSWYPRRAELTGDRTAEMLDYLDRLAAEVIYSPQHHLAPPYTVGAGDTLPQLAKLFAVPWELLAKINRITTPNDLKNGQQLKVIHGPFHAEVHPTKFELTLLLGSKQLYAGRFRIGTGSQVALQEGTYTVTRKYRNPVYYPDPKGDRSRMIPGGDPLNPLGQKMVEFETSDTPPLFGALHGTHDPTTIGTHGKEGCIRLTPNDINDLFDMLTIGESRIVVQK